MLSSPTTYRSQARTDVQVLPGASHSDAWSYVAGRGPLPTQQPATHDPAAGRVRSEFDIPTASQLELTLGAAQVPPVVLDLREHAFIDGCGKHAIACAGSRARQAGRQLVLVRVPSGSHFRERGSPRTSPMSGNRHDPVDRGARKGSTS